jgi:hypothetical protein
MQITQNSPTGVFNVTGQQSPELRSATLRLLVIPFAIYTAWLLETFLLEGSMHTFERFDPPGIFLYTIIACIITGIVAPLLYIRNTFKTHLPRMCPDLQCRLRSRHPFQSVRD